MARLDRGRPDSMPYSCIPRQSPGGPAGPSVSIRPGPAPARLAGATRADPGPGSGATGPALSAALDAPPACA
ncbi:hypothetical protein ACPA9J_16165 [Pseudomonas aeruginosa]